MNNEEEKTELSIVDLVARRIHEEQAAAGTVERRKIENVPRITSKRSKATKQAEIERKVMEQADLVSRSDRFLKLGRKVQENTAFRSISANDAIKTLQEAGAEVARYSINGVVFVLDETEHRIKYLNSSTTSAKYVSSHDLEEATRMCKSRRKSKMMQSEEVEQIDELSKQTLGSYAKKALPSALEVGRKMDLRMRMPADNPKQNKKLDKEIDKGIRRKRGVKLAIDKLSRAPQNESVEQIDEGIKKGSKAHMYHLANKYEKLSDQEHNSYLNRGTAEYEREPSGRKSRKYDWYSDEGDKFNKQMGAVESEFKKHFPDIHSKSKYFNYLVQDILDQQYEESIKAAKKTNESVEQIDELSKQTLGSYAKKAQADIVKSGVAAGMVASNKNMVGSSGDSSSKLLNKGRRRLIGQQKAINRLSEQNEVDSVVKTIAEDVFSEMARHPLSNPKKEVPDEYNTDEAKAKRDARAEAKTKRLADEAKERRDAWNNRHAKYNTDQAKADRAARKKGGFYFNTRKIPDEYDTDEAMVKRLARIEQRGKHVDPLAIRDKEMIRNTGKYEKPDYRYISGKTKEIPAWARDGGKNNSILNTYKIKGPRGPLPEETENIQELSTDTLRRYMDTVNTGKLADGYGYRPGDDAAANHKAWQRMKGMNRASEIVRDRETPIMDPQIHDFTDHSDGEVYDATQYMDGINDGDILKMSGGRIGIMYKAWPTMHTGSSDVLHTLKLGSNWNTVDRGRYAASHEKALQFVHPAISEDYEVIEVGFTAPVIEEGRKPRDSQDDDETHEADMNIVNQLRKAADSGLRPTELKFADGSSMSIGRSKARAVLSKVMSLKPADRMNALNSLGKSASAIRGMMGET